MRARPSLRATRKLSWPPESVKLGAPATPPGAPGFLRSNGQNLFFFGLNDVVDGLSRLGHDLFDFLFGAFDLVLTGTAAVFYFSEHVERLVAGLAHAHFTLLAVLLGELHQVLAALFAERRDRNANQVPVDLRIEPQIRLAQGLFRGLDLGFVPRLDREQARLGHADRGHLADRRGLPVVVDTDRVEHRRMRAAGSELGGLATQGFLRLLDCLPQFVQYIVDHLRTFDGAERVLYHQLETPASRSQAVRQWPFSNSRSASMALLRAAFFSAPPDEPRAACRRPGPPSRHLASRTASRPRAACVDCRLPPPRPRGRLPDARLHRPRACA